LSAASGATLELFSTSLGAKSLATRKNVDDIVRRSGRTGDYAKVLRLEAANFAG
jgi:hypothetical protein